MSIYKTFSSPNLRGSLALNGNRNQNQANDPYQQTGADMSASIEHDCQHFVIGDRVLVDNLRSGSVAYFGELDFSTGDWVGVVLDEPRGNHDGKIHGREYFHCSPNHGLFVRPTRLRRLPDPVWPPSRLNASMPQSSTPVSGRSTADSSSHYYYDEDYRSGSQPSVESLRRKLNSINHDGPRKYPYIRTSDQESMDNNPDYRRSFNAGSTSSKQPATGSILKGGQFYKGKASSNLTRRPSAPNLAAPSQPGTFNFRPQRCQEYYHDDHQDPHLLSSPYKLQFKLGDRVLVKSEQRGQLTGTLRYLGETMFATGEWAGVQLDLPDGKNDGTVLGYRYFRCPENYGLFVPVTRIARLIGNNSNYNRADFLSQVKSTIKSPPPHSTTITRDNYHSVSPSGRYSTNTPSSQISSGMSSSPSSYYNNNNNYNNNNSGEDDHDLSAKKSRDHTDESQSQSPSPTQSSSRSSSSALNNEIKRRPYKPINQYESKYLESDLNNSLRRYLDKTKYHYEETLLDRQPSKGQPIPASVQYTFKSSKYDGNPIAVKTVHYDN